MVALNSHSIPRPTIAAKEKQDKAVVIVDISSGTAGLTALPTPHTFVNSTRMPGGDKIATSPVDGIRVMTSVRQTVEKEQGRGRMGVSGDEFL